MMRSISTGRLQGRDRHWPRGAFQEDQIQFLNAINNEAKVRRPTKSLVLQKAKVMSYEDLEEARGYQRRQRSQGQGQTWLEVQKCCAQMRQSQMRRCYE